MTQLAGSGCPGSAAHPPVGPAGGVALPAVAPLPAREAPAPARTHSGGAEAAVAELIEMLGEDPAREGLARTPERVVRSLRWLTAGRHHRAAEELAGAVYEEPGAGMLAVRDVELYSLCEHHLLPFFGRAHIAYLPDGRVIGPDELPRVVDLCARRLQVQERLTRQIADALEELIAPAGVAVAIEASHLCAMMRGVEKQRSRAVTSTVRGAFLDDPGAGAALLHLVPRAGHHG